MGTAKKVILLIETSRGYGRGLLTGIAEYCRLHGPWSFYREPGGLDLTLPPRFNWDADGIIMRDSAKARSLLSLGLPIIVVLHEYPPMKETTCILTDDTAIGKMAARHFLEKGFFNFAYCGIDRMHWSRNRCQSFQESIRQAAFKVHVYKQPRNKLGRSWKNEQIILANWLRDLPKPVGLLACNDDRAQYIIEACKNADIRIPDQVAILGVDNDTLICNLANPTFSSIALNTKRAGYEAAEILDRRMNREERKFEEAIIVHPTHIAARQSTDFLAVADHEVALAIRFIKDHARKVIQVNDVVESSSLSRRVLEKRFRRVLNYSILDMIKTTHTEQVIKLLVETNISVFQIAKTLGHPAFKHFARSFRQVTGMTPLAYRKKYGHK